ncbi:hypothetical protein DRO53_00760 [Candidatus Bathyarchaeota archaeon]|nr:MAG: hypothetical protein DRO53_00760 [Candidatus Bathyarchaeota archaeon]
MKAKKSIVVEGLRKLAEKCLQCGKCSSICPPTRFSEKGFNARRFSLAVLRGEEKELFHEAWSCFLCYDCVKLCPHRVNLPEAIISLRRTINLEGLAGEMFSSLKPFLENILETGRVVSVADARLRRKLKLPEDPSLPEETLRKVKVFMGEVGLFREAEKLREIYGG